MKAILGLTAILWVLLAWFPTAAQAQIHQPRQHFFEIAGGLADGLQFHRTEGTAYWARISMGKYGKKEGTWQAGVSTQTKYYALAGRPVSPVPPVSLNRLIRVDQYLAEGSFSPKGFRTRNRIVYINPGLGILGGYERVVKAEAQQNLSKALLGLSGGLTAEVNLSHWLSLAFYGKTHYLPTSKVEDFHFQYGLGVRFNFFKQ